MDISKFKFNLVPSSPESKLGIEIWLDCDQVYNISWVDKPMSINVDVPVKDENTHQLRLILKNKLPEHTTLSSTGEIVRDSTISVESITVDDLDFNHSINKTIVYQHDCNGTQPLNEHPFYGIMGCNGTVIINFQTPIYLWLLEHI